MIDRNTGIGIFISLTGIGIFITSFFSQTVELQIALLIAALGLFAAGLAQIIHSIERKQDIKDAEERHRQITARLEEIQQQFEKQEQPKNSGIAIADFLSAGLKYYTEHKQQKEENDD